MSNGFETCPSTLEEAKKRNRKIIEVWKLRLLSGTEMINLLFKQDLEQARAYLRSRVIYSPLEAILEKAQKNYFTALGTPVRKKYGPVYV